MPEFDQSYRETKAIHPPPDALPTAQVPKITTGNDDHDSFVAAPTLIRQAGGELLHTSIVGMSDDRGPEDNLPLRHILPGTIQVAGQAAINEQAGDGGDVPPKPPIQAPPSPDPDDNSDDSPANKRDSTPINDLQQPTAERTEAVKTPPKPEEAPNVDKIAVTALNNAALMTYSGIPLYSEISAIASEKWAAADHEAQPQIIEPQVNGPGIEMRYRLGTALTADAPQVLEIASGLTPRGVTMTAQDSTITYVEFDLPVMTDLKRDVIETLAERGVIPAKPDNLHLETGDARVAESLTNATRHFDPQLPVAVTTEGILHYMSHQEKETIAKNIHTILSRHGDASVWLTDMPVQRGITEIDTPMASTTTEQTGRSIAENRFADEAEARQFFAQYGLEVKQQYSYIDPALLDSLTSPAVVGATREKLIEDNRPWSMWAFGLATS